MNLGQLVGELRYGVLEPRPRPELVAAQERARAEEAHRRAAEEEAARIADAQRRADEYNGRAAKREKARLAREAWRAAHPRPAPKPRGRPRRHQSGTLRGLLEQHPEGLTVVQIRAALGRDAPINIIKALAQLSVDKSGRRHHFVYRLKTQSPTPEKP